MTFNLFNRSVWPPNFKDPPWGSRKSIYDHIADHVDPNNHAAGLSEDGFLLPDELDSAPNSISFAPGAIDGIFGHHGTEKSKDEIVSGLYSALAFACNNASDRNIRALYTLFCSSSAIEVIDPLIERINLEQTLDADRLLEIIYWFTTKAADSEPVKFSMALLGSLHGGDNSVVFLTLGKHDEFTLYSAIAISNNDVYDDEVLWVLAKSVEGWGRIHTVELLSETKNPKIQDWLLRDGFKNGVMYEYLACICARAGELHIALGNDVVDTELFNSAIEIISALISGEGGPAEGLGEYEHGCTAIRHLLENGDGKFSSASHYQFLCKLRERVSDHLSGEQEINKDWTIQDAEAIINRIDELISNQDWKKVVLNALQNGDQQTFWNASRACDKLGIDPWPYFFEKTRAGEDYWWDLMRLSDASRIDDILALGREKIPLDHIATGPSDELGLGMEYASHDALDFILQDLGRYPGKGWEFVEAGLQSPVVRNRNMALKALSEWSSENWPAGAGATLQTFMDAEPEADVKRRFKKLLAGRDLD